MCRAPTGGAQVRPIGIVGGWRYGGIRGGPRAPLPSLIRPRWAGDEDKGPSDSHVGSFVLPAWLLTSLAGNAWDSLPERATMTQNNDPKAQIRARMAATGKLYSVAARHALLAAALAALTALSAVGTAIATAAPASAEVLFNDDAGTIPLGHSLEVGVWYQQFSGGPTGYWAGVWSYPQHKWVFTRSGHATTTWKFWYIKPADRGKYATVYDTAYMGRDYRTVFYTTVR